MRGRQQSLERARVGTRTNRTRPPPSTRASITSNNDTNPGFHGVALPCAQQSRRQPSARWMAQSFSGWGLLCTARCRSACARALGGAASPARGSVSSRLQPSAQLPGDLPVPLPIVAAAAFSCSLHRPPPSSRRPHPPPPPRLWQLRTVFVSIFGRDRCWPSSFCTA